MSKTKDSKIAPAIHLENISLRYKNNQLFSNFKLFIPAGKTICLLGTSGVGKSTLLRLLADLPTGASTQQKKIYATDHQPIKGRISYMAQQDLLMPWLDVLANTLLGYNLRGQKTDTTLRKKALDLLKKLGLADAINKKPPALSGGMRQRVALARTLLEERPIVLMDEPFSALDAITRFRMQNLAATLLTGKSVLLVTHDPLEALRLGNIIYVLSGNPAELGEPIIPSGQKPRDNADKNIIELQATLLKQLAKDNSGEHS